MQIVSTVVARPLEACWKVFTNPTKMTAWVAGLRAAWVIDLLPDGLPAAVQFEFSTDLVYTLTYTYDFNAYVVRWEPQPGEVGGVRGFARFEPHADGTQFTYALEHEPGRKALERAFDNPRVLVDAFARMMHET